jgi:DNA polymerase III subunit chi
MTRIDFYYNSPDRLSTARILCQKAHQAGKRVFVYAPEPQLAADIDRLLWTRPARSFIPHCPAESPVASQTPILIGDDPDRAGIMEILLNLNRDLPGFFSRFERVLEIVGADTDDRPAARERFRFYQKRGYELHMHDLGSV